MLPLLLLAADAPATAVDAERAFYRAAQTKGQWTAFREFAAEDAVVFTPQPAKAQEVLPSKNPAIAVQWWPADSFVSCDGTVAVNTGPWVRPGSVGYFTTVWVKQPDGQWKWVMDSGDELAKPRALPETPRVKRAQCRGKPPSSGAPIRTGSAAVAWSPDRTLRWGWTMLRDGGRVFIAALWNGKGYDEVVHDAVAAPK